MKYSIKQPAFLANARKKYPCISTAIIIVAVAGLLLSGDSLAARDGSIGPSSTGQITISVYVPESVQVQNLQDLSVNFNQGSTISNAQGTDACIYSSSGAYTLTAQNNNGVNNSGYAMMQGSEHLLPYQLNVSDSSNHSANNLLQAGNSVTLNSSSDATCSTGNNLHIQMQLPNGNAIAPDHYRDIVNFTVAPV